MRLIKRYSPPGTAPGRLPPARPDAAPVRFALTRYDAEKLLETRIGALEELPDPAPGEVTWLDVAGHDPAVLAHLRERLDIHPLVIEDVVNVGQRPKVEDHGRYLFVVVELITPAAAARRLEREQVSLLLFPGLLVSIQEREGDVFGAVRERLRGGRGRIRGSGADYLAYALVDAVVDHLFPLLERIGEELEAIEEELIARPQQVHLERLHELRRELLQLRRSAWPLRELLAGLMHPDSELITADTRVFLRDVHDHAVHVIEMVEVYREVIAGLMDLYLSSLSNRMNEVMKVLTIIATIFIPLSFIAGVYGMNFQLMPELTWRWGYPFALALMAGTATGLLVFFRRKRWI